MRISALLLSLCLAAPALAQPAPDPDTEVARRHFKAGSEAYDGGHYAEAIREFEAAADLKPLPDFDFNIGRCYDRLGNWRAAARYYEKYIAAKPDAPDGADVRARITVLHGRIQKNQAPPTETEADPFARRPPQPPPPERLPAPKPRAEEPPAAPSPSSSSGLKIGAWTVGALALASAIAGIALVVSVGPDYDTLQTTCRSMPCTSSSWSDLELRADVGYAMWGLAGALAVTDIVLIALAVRQPREQPRAWIAPTVGGFTVGGRF